MNPNHGTAGQDTAEVARQLRDKIAAQIREIAKRPLA